MSTSDILAPLQYHALFGKSACCAIVRFKKSILGSFCLACARQTVDAHEEMRAQEGIQLSSSGGSPAMRRCCIGVPHELLHQCRGQEALQQLQGSLLRWHRLSLVSKARQRHIDGVQVVRPLLILLCGCGSLLLFFLLAAAALCLVIPLCAALLSSLFQLSCSDRRSAAATSRCSSAE